MRLRLRVETDFYNFRIWGKFDEHLPLDFAGVIICRVRLGAGHDMVFCALSQMESRAESTHCEYIFEVVATSVYLNIRVFVVMTHPKIH